MYARYGLNKKGERASWRCYGDFLETFGESCIDNNGEMSQESSL